MVPVKLQGALLKKVFAFDKTLNASGRIEVLVVFENVPGEDHSAVVQAFNELSVSARAVAMTDLENELGPTTVIYLPVGTPSVREVSRKHGTLTVGGNHSLVHAGEAVIAIGMLDGKPRILINQTALQASRHEMSSKLLQLATLVE